MRAPFSVASVLVMVAAAIFVSSILVICVSAILICVGIIVGGIVVRVGMTLRRRVAAIAGMCVRVIVAGRRMERVVATA